MERIGETLNALMCLNPDGSRTIFARVLGAQNFMPFVFAEKAALERTIAKTRPALEAIRKAKGVTFEICTFTLSERKPLP